MTSVPLLRKESQYTLDNKSYDSIQMENLYKQNLVNSLPRTGSGVSLHASGNGSKRSSLISPQEPPSPKINKNENRHSKRMSRLSQQISMQSKYISTQRPKVKRWKLYEGKSKLFLHGRIVTGNDSFTFFLSTLLIIGPCVLLMIFILPEFNIIYTYLFAYGTVFCTASLLKTSWTDPGILPRNLELLPTEIHFNNNNNSEDSIELPESSYDNSSNKRYNNDQSPYSSTTHLNQNHNQNQNNLSSTYPFIAPTKTYIPPMRNIIVNGRIVSQKFCSTCKIYRPPRSFHCSYCDNCVENCDHHCPWTANCIGKRNYRYFYAFISSATFLCLAIFIISSIFIGNKFREKKLNYDIDGFLTCMTQCPVPFILIAFVTLSLCFVGFLFVYHTYLICKNITTHENIKEIYIPNTTRSYFSSGNAFKNILLVLFRPVPPSRFAMRQKISVPLNTTNPDETNSPTVNPFYQEPSSSSNNNNYKLNIDD
ncbi:zf-DHHC-domain-containing protein [Anaeromyces robustus]|uniref:Palmitoyltransferase n=1 Tax=Anaeromyces robustus TaxID=1754192 RepID=A0A1Y1WAC7_9FUNG|nr:zf-DHHC-domain-containing protein [Anaeromyces robustus]|eukprot:ORX70402.1 zf-DHHC-domain-containing protein [Anaeromyces robustus]